jgi:hypothetical protein
MECLYIQKRWKGIYKSVALYESKLVACWFFVVVFPLFFGVWRAGSLLPIDQGVIGFEGADDFHC